MFLVNTRDFSLLVKTPHPENEEDFKERVVDSSGFRTSEYLSNSKIPLILIGSLCPEVSWNDDNDQ